jgi:hypothetical protein
MVAVSKVWGGVPISPTASEGSYHRTCPAVGWFRWEGSLLKVL